jgi:sterol desaturase/sphingolipid hydroxylase (fatty acid hydroxylase superfamily)
MPRASQWISGAVVLAGSLVFLWVETLRPLRRRREERIRRVARNLSTAGLGLATIELLQAPLLVPASRWVTDGGVGLLCWVGARGWIRLALTILLMDYTLWWWHRINHRIPFLWRFHAVHHVDRDLDASTGVRFHFGELGLSVFYRALQVVVIGADPLGIWVWQLLLFSCVLFHHSNTRLPVSVERVLVRAIVTPRMHGIHHSDFRNETDSNWSSLFSVWDYLHRTIRLDVPQDDVTIGVAAIPDPRQVTLGRILAMPFRPQPDYWRRPDGSEAIRPHPEASSGQLQP